MKKVLFIRLDKIGDLICTLPVDQLLGPTYEVSWVVQKGLGSVVDLSDHQRTYFELDKSDQKASQKKLDEFVKALKPDVAISFQAPWWVNYVLWKNKVPLRGGVLSQWHSFLFLNRGLRQKRSEAIKHEFDYNKDLVLNTFKIPDTRQFLFFQIRKLDPISVESFLTAHNLKVHSYTVVHPGMMGSALNWPQKKYIQYIQKLIRQNEIVCITGTDADNPYLEEIRSEFFLNSDLKPEYQAQLRWLQSKLNLNELITLLSQAKKVVAPSTGVAHLAASLGVETHGIYSPIKVHHPTRWAPRGPNVHIHLPKLTAPCPAEKKCLKEQCPQFNCMNTLEVP